MSDFFLGQIISVGFNFAPVGWFPCDGRSLPIAQYDALFSLLGTTYGGDGVQTFNLPNLNGAVPLGAGQGPGLSPYVQGQVGGFETVTLTAAQGPAHSHTLMASSQAGAAAQATTAMALAQNAQTAVNMYGPAPATTSLLPSSISTSSGGQPHENRQPYLTIFYIIAYSGIYPSQQ
jgi:microcystin-dependent protein